MKVGYARVSTEDQSLEIQIKELEAAGCERIFCEKASGKKAEDRPELKAIVGFVREGDTIVVCKLDRLARNTLDTLNTVIGLGEKGVFVVSLSEPWVATNGPTGKLILTIFAAFAEWERERIRERQMAGIAAARERGVYRQEKRARRSARLREKVALMKQENPKLTPEELGRMVNRTPRTIYRMLPGEFGPRPESLSKAERIKREAAFSARVERPEPDETKPTAVSR